MATVIVDAVSTVARLNAATSGTNATGSLTVAASANFAVIYISTGLQFPALDTTIAFSTLTLGGSALTHITGALKHSGSDASQAGFVDMYYLPSPAAGANTLSATMTYTGGGSIGQLLCWSVSYKNVNLTNPLGTAQTANGLTSASLTLTDTLTADDMIVGICCNGTAAPGITTGTSDISQAGGTTTASDNARVAHNAGSGSTNLVYSTVNTDFSGATGVKLNAVPVVDLLSRNFYRVQGWQ